MKQITENTAASAAAPTTTAIGKDHLVFPGPINSERIGWLVTKGVEADIAAIDMEMVNMKLGDKDEGNDWTKPQADEAELEYKRFLTLSKRHGKGIVPTKQIDVIWHCHILDTRAYHQDSQKIFGGYFHHYPYFGMRGEQDAKDLEGAFRRTQKLYQEAFGEVLSSPEGADCWHDCSGRCWHACSNDD